MKNLKIYLEDAGLVATPANTMGMGNPMPPTEGEPGSEPLVPTAKPKKEKCKKHKKHLKESLLDDDDKLFVDTGQKAIIEKFIRDNYIGSTHKLEITDDFVVNCKGDLYIKNKKLESLTNGLFTFGEVEGDFYCDLELDHKSKLKSLEGAPKKVGGEFSCTSCQGITSLEGAPKECDKFFCCHCHELKNLKGAPKKCNIFKCFDCASLESLEGSPRTCKEFYCGYNTNLKSLKGAPKKCHYFMCTETGFTEKDARAVCDAKLYSCLKKIA